eukprot:8933087-Pyramimonas_sp.AAC.1
MIFSFSADHPRVVAILRLDCFDQGIVVFHFHRRDDATLELADLLGVLVRRAKDDEHQVFHLLAHLRRGLRLEASSATAPNSGEGHLLGVELGLLVHRRVVLALAVLAHLAP